MGLSKSKKIFSVVEMIFWVDFYEIFLFLFSLMQELKFEQKRTMIAKMLNATMDMFESHPGSQENAKLLVILSDGRGAFSEGRDTILRAVRRAKLSDVFIVFVIVDNPKSKVLFQRFL